MAYQFGLTPAISHREDMLQLKGKMPAIVKYALTYFGGPRIPACAARCR